MDTNMVILFRIRTDSLVLSIFFSIISFSLSIEALQPTILQNDQPKIRNIKDYRIVNWCITGKDEPALHTWPFNQFIPILRRTHRFIHDERNFRYDLRFYEIQTTGKDIGNQGAIFKTVHVVLKAERKRDPKIGIKEIWEPFPLEGLLIQANHNPGTLGLPTGQFFEGSSDEIQCLDGEDYTMARSIPCRKRPIFAVEHPTVMIFHHLMSEVHATTTDTTIGKQPEIHANFRWYSTPCAETRRLQFFVLAVRSFQRNEYDILRKGPYKVIVRDQNFHSDNFPSPYYYHFTGETLCHIKSSSDIVTQHPRKFFNFEMSSKFDCCTKYEENPKSQDTLEEIDEFFSFSCKDIKTNQMVPLTILKGHESFTCYFPASVRPCSTDDIERSDLNYLPCSPCPTLPSTTTEVPTTTPFSVYKRTIHGGLMIMTNFCIQPLVIYIARFYKETFNVQSFKGDKLWYWMHLAGGMISSGMIYFGYFSGAITKQGNNDHVIIGNTYIITLGLCYLTSFGRHKHKYINLCAEFFHGSLGYVTISLALACVVTAPGVGLMSKLLVYIMVTIQCIFMVIMTAHICILDNKFGMRPKRRHFPTIEARFDEVEVPKGKFRIIMLVILACCTFALSFASTFIQ